jgi:DNA repair protein RecN (Recombination protein N)
MLQSLTIKDFAIIDALEVELGPGLCAMTGETGAGKTIIVEALKLVLGARASTDIIRTGKDRASVTAVFDSRGVPEPLATAMADAGIELGDEIIIHRVVGAQGKGKISVNGVATTVSMLREIAAHLVDVSSQHDNQLLLDETRHAPMLDEFANLGELHSEYVAAHSRYAEARRELETLESNERAAKEKLEFLKFQLSELEKAAICEGEFESLEAERSRIKHSVLLKEKASGAHAAIAGEETSASMMVSHATQMLEQCAEYEPRAKGWCDALGRAAVELEEAARELDNYVDGLGSDPARLEEIEDRLHLIKGLARKHGGSVETLLARQVEIVREVNEVENYDDLLEAKRAELDDLSKRRADVAGRLSKARKKAAAEMGKRVVSQLGDLSMAKTGFVVETETRGEDEWDESGPDRVEFMISPNVGEPLMPLAKIASGGELSRIMLALKGALARSEEIAGTSVFDEVDSGIGGGVASVVGKKLRDLAKCRQVICITHLPQVAAHAANHLRIAKGVAGGRTTTSLDSLDDAGRVSEIARMLGGEKLTDTTIKHAEEMIKEAKT